MSLKVKLPKDFKPSEIPIFKNNDRPDLQYWIYNGNKSKKYADSTAEETYKWIKEIYNRIGIEDSSQLGLMPIKSKVIDISLDLAISKSRDLFGGPRYWDSLEDWQRLSKLQGKSEKNNDKE